MLIYLTLLFEEAVVRSNSYKPNRYQINNFPLLSILSSKPNLKRHCNMLLNIQAAFKKANNKKYILFSHFSKGTSNHPNPEPDYLGIDRCPLGDSPVP